MPPYLAGRTAETGEFGRLLKQDTILENLVLTGLRGVGKTVLLDTFKPIAMQAGWHWVGTDLSEAMSLTELTIAIRLLTDLSVVTSSITIGIDEIKKIGFGDRKIEVPRNLDYRTLSLVYEETPGLAADKIKAVLELVWKREHQPTPLARGDAPRGFLLPIVDVHHQTLALLLHADRQGHDETDLLGVGRVDRVDESDLRRVNRAL